MFTIIKEELKLFSFVFLFCLASILVVLLCAEIHSKIDGQTHWVSAYKGGHFIGTIGNTYLYFIMLPKIAYRSIVSVFARRSLDQR